MCVCTEVWILRPILDPVFAAEPPLFIPVFLAEVPLFIPVFCIRIPLFIPLSLFLLTEYYIFKIYRMFVQKCMLFRTSSF